MFKTMQTEIDRLTRRYDRAAPAWPDKMRALGYGDAYHGFLGATFPALPGASSARVADIGAGTGAFAEAWMRVHGPGSAITLLDPSAAMLARGTERLAEIGQTVNPVRATLQDFKPEAPFDVVLAAHVIEHGDGAAMLGQLRGLVQRGGRLFLVVSKPHWCNAIVWLQWRHRSYPPAVLRGLLDRTGWVVTAEHAFAKGPPSRTSRGYACKAV
ncbi:MAG: class I SAM-dependent methyltransferase [Pseudomonadota bacterium]